MTGNKLNDTAKRYICEAFDSWERGVNYSFTSKYTDKGLIMEDEAIELVKAKIYGEPQNLKQKRFFDLIEYKKNELKFSNEWITGTPDVIRHEGHKIVDDIKCSYTRATWLFSISQMVETQTVCDEYYWQLQGYMMLTGAQESYLCYCLMDTPLHIVEMEIRKATYGMEFEEAQKVAKGIEKLHNFDGLDRVYMRKVQRNDRDIERIKERVEAVNHWVDRYINMQEQDISELEVFAV